MSSKTVLVTGAAGFIGYHLAQKLLSQDLNVVGLDNLNDYYEVSLKEARLSLLKVHGNFKFIKGNLHDRELIENLFALYKFDYVINLAAQAGVRYSIQNPFAYLESNVQGFLNILEACRHHMPLHLIYASSSSVYGTNKQMPFSVNHNVDHPISLYAASKKTNELMAHTYSALYKIPTTGLRFFTVYGPYGRPDMAYFLFTKAILEGKPIKVFNNGKMKRDFTYVDDIVEGIVKLLNKIPLENLEWSPIDPNPSSSFAPYKLYNIGNNEPVDLLSFIETLERKLGKKALKEFLPMQDGDVPETYADIDELVKDAEFKPSTRIDFGLEKFVEWYLGYYLR
jgi:UDP-glucuronate 4-epimerase